MIWHEAVMGVRGLRVVFTDESYVGDRYGCPIGWKMEWSDAHPGDHILTAGLTWRITWVGPPKVDAALWPIEAVGWPANDSRRNLPRTGIKKLARELGWRA